MSYHRPHANALRAAQTREAKNPRQIHRDNSAFRLSPADVPGLVAVVRGAKRISAFNAFIDERINQMLAEAGIPSIPSKANVCRTTNINFPRERTPG